jgi:hypothetical protein
MFMACPFFAQVFALLLAVCCLDAVYMLSLYKAVTLISPVYVAAIKASGLSLAWVCILLTNKIVKLTDCSVVVVCFFRVLLVCCGLASLLVVACFPSSLFLQVWCFCALVDHKFIVMRSCQEFCLTLMSQGANEREGASFGVRRVLSHPPLLCR